MNTSTEEHSRASQASSKSQQAFMEMKAPSSRVAASAPSLKASAAKSGLAVEHKPMAREQKWWENYNEVKRIYDEYGHLTMPEQRLRHWLSYQRNHASSLTIYQVKALEEIQYRHLSNFRKSDEEEWQANFNRLVSDPNSQEDDEKIKRWIARQRRLKQLGELSDQKTKMLEEHVYLGTRNGLCGKRKRSGKRRDAYWSEMFERLLEYQKKNGDLNVPARYPEDKSLGYWVLEQRRRFRQTDKDGLQKMEQDKVEKLNSIGFVWNIKPLKK